MFDAPMTLSQVKVDPASTPRYMFYGTDEADRLFTDVAELPQGIGAPRLGSYSLAGCSCGRRPQG